MTQGINDFGFLTIGGRQIKFEKFDKDGNGEISAQEYQQTLQELGISEDTVEFSSVDKNNDKKISGEEFVIMEQRIEMEDALKKFIIETVNKEITDPVQNKTVTQELKAYIEEFIESYGNKNLDKMSAKFVESLPAKYEEIKADVVGEPKGRGGEFSDENISNVVENIVENLRGLSREQAKELFTHLKEIAEIIIYNNSHVGSINELERRLKKYIDGNPSEILKYAIQNYESSVNSFGDYVSTNEFEKLRDKVEEFFKFALGSGIVITVNGKKIDNESAIKDLLDKFKPTTAWALQNLMTKIKEGLSTESNLARFKNGETGINIQMDIIDNLRENEPDGLDLNGLSEDKLNKIDKIIDYFYTLIKQNQPDAEGWKMLYWIGRNMEKLAVNYVKNHKDALPEDDNIYNSPLAQYLENYMFRNDTKKMKEAITAWDKAVSDAGTIVNAEELRTLGNVAKEFIIETFKYGIQICDKDGNRLNKEQLIAIIDNLVEAEDDVNLMKFINNIKNNLSKTVKYEQLLNSQNGCDKIIIDTETYEAALQPNINENGEVILDEQIFDDIDTKNLFEDDEDTWWWRTSIREHMYGNLKSELSKVWNTLCLVYGIDKLTDQDFDSFFATAYNNVECNHFTLNLYGGTLSDFADEIVAEFKSLIENLLNPEDEIVEEDEIHEEEVTEDEPSENDLELDDITVEGDKKKYTRAEIQKYMEKNLMPTLREKAKAMCKKHGVEYSETKFREIYDIAFFDTAKMGRYYGKHGSDTDTTKVTPNKFAGFIKEKFGKNYTEWVKKHKE